MKEKQLKELLESLSIEEKIGQLIQLSGDFYTEDAELKVGPQQKLGISREMVALSGSVLNVTGAERVRRIQESYLKNSRHKIPLLFMADVVYGYKTVYPIPLGIGASFNPQLITGGYRKIALEAMAAGVDIDMKTACYANQLKPLIEDGKISEEKIDAAVWRILKLKNKLGLFEDPYKLSVQVPHAQIQIGGEQQPEEVGDLQFASQRRNPAELLYHGDDQCDEQ